MEQSGLSCFSALTVVWAANLPVYLGSRNCWPFMVWTFSTICLRTPKVNNNHPYITLQMETSFFCFGGFFRKAISTVVFVFVAVSARRFLVGVCPSGLCGGACLIFVPVCISFAGIALRFPCHGVARPHLHAARIALSLLASILPRSVLPGSLLGRAVCSVSVKSCSRSSNVLACLKTKNS